MKAYEKLHGIRADYAGTVTIGANTNTVVSVEENYKGASSLSAGIGGTAGTITITILMAIPKPPLVRME